MSQAKQGDTVRIHYTGTLDDGTQFDSSSGRDPLEFTIGSGQVIPGFDQAVEGMAVGDSKSVNIAPQENLEPVPGMALQARGDDGKVINLTVTHVGDDDITVDGNHPLAGHNLNFDIELVEIATTA